MWVVQVQNAKLSIDLGGSFWKIKTKIRGELQKIRGWEVKVSKIALVKVIRIGNKNIKKNEKKQGFGPNSKFRKIFAEE